MTLLQQNLGKNYFNYTNLYLYMYTFDVLYILLKAKYEYPLIIYCIIIKFTHYLH